MPSRLPKHLFDAIAAARLAREFSAGLSFEAYAANALVRSAVERQLEILGEACQRMLAVDPTLRQRVPDTGLAIGLRNRIIHGYDRIENAVVYDTLMRDLPALETALAGELARYPAP
ncbi:MAG TPA: HepT-like ribonuclease domain-containing protein [Methylibium sp.]|nr:HepT-like ribonuclease domain-containing protein [Methylibium sp.]